MGLSGAQATPQGWLQQPTADLITPRVCFLRHAGAKREPKGTSGKGAVAWHLHLTAAFRVGFLGKLWIVAAVGRKTDHKGSKVLSILCLCFSVFHFPWQVVGTFPTVGQLEYFRLCGHLGSVAVFPDKTRTNQQAVFHQNFISRQRKWNFMTQF